MNGELKPRPTRFEELGYVQQARGLWRFVAMEDNRVVGPQYRTKAELLADLAAYAREAWGLE